ncbi:MAG TPA: glycosyltransferase [Bacteroidia bacterium]|nr:glycosyltransferase [Bacteroidia bacterium]
MKRVIVSVINDLVTDQRVHRTCTTLHELGYDVLLVGRHKHDSLTMPARDYKVHRMNLAFEKGMMFYISFQFRLFFFLRRNKADIYFANDLDTLYPNYLVSKWRKKPLLYDTHEIFTEVPELVNRKFKQNIWRRWEGRIFPKLKNVFTVNSSIADWYEKKYGIRPHVMRNIPPLANTARALTRGEVHLPENKKVILLQGAGINVDRGAEELVDAMQFVNDAVLLIIGGGDVIAQLKERAAQEHLEGRIIFTGKLPPHELRAWTKLADIGVTMDKDTNINYRFSLPNKIFDYIHAGIPVLAFDLVEVKNIVEKYKVGKISPSHDPEVIAKTINEMICSPEFVKWKMNTISAAKELNWENEKRVLVEVMNSL